LTSVTPPSGMRTHAWAGVDPELLELNVTCTVVYQRRTCVRVWRSARE